MSAVQADPPAARMDLAAVTGGTRLALHGRLELATLETLWPQALERLARTPGAVVVDAQGITACDGAGIAFLLDLLRQPRPQAQAIRIEGLAPPFAAMLARFDPHALQVPPGPSRRHGAVEELGRQLASLRRDAAAQVTYLGALLEALGVLVRRPQALRWGDVWRCAESAGADAVPVVSLIAFLFGAILAFQSAVPMRQFGAELYVANLIGLSLLRELGPLMTAIILAGRTGAAFAAELGTMKVNEEISALRTLGLDPVRFLVLPRVLACVLVAVPLTLLADLVGLVGGGVVMTGFGVPPVSYLNQMGAAVHFPDFLGGLAKALAFGGLVGGIGCLRGLETEGGPTAVGRSATRAVVSGIVLIILADGLAALVYNRLAL